MTKHYKPLDVCLNEVCGMGWAVKAMRLPKRSFTDSDFNLDTGALVELGPGDENLYLLEGSDGSWVCKFAYENRTEYEKTRQYMDAVLDKIGELNGVIQ